MDRLSAERSFTATNEDDHDRASIRLHLRSHKSEIWQGVRVQHNIAAVRCMIEQDEPISGMLACCLVLDYAINTQN